MKPLKEKKDYLLIPDREDEQAFAIRIINDAYFGVVYRYETLKIEEKNDEAFATFDYTILEQPEDSIIDKVAFEQFISSVLHDIITNAVISDQVKRKENNGSEHTDRNPEASDTE
jgi:hypothetical protein